MYRGHKPITFKIKKNGCWICLSHARNNKGYPRITWKGTHTSIPRWIYQQINGDLKKRLVVRHKCDNPSCINPAHLESGTYKDNTQDAITRGRMCRGENKPSAKLTKEQVQTIIKSTEGPQELGRKYNMAHTTIIRIKQGKKWSYLQ